MLCRRHPARPGIAGAGRRDRRAQGLEPRPGPARRPPRDRATRRSGRPPPLRPGQGIRRVLPPIPRRGAGCRGHRRRMRVLHLRVLRRRVPRAASHGTDVGVPGVRPERRGRGVAVPRLSRGAARRARPRVREGLRRRPVPTGPRFRSADLQGDRAFDRATVRTSRRAATRLRTVHGHHRTSSEAGPHLGQDANRQERGRRRGPARIGQVGHRRAALGGARRRRGHRRKRGPDDDLDGPADQLGRSCSTR